MFGTTQTHRTGILDLRPMVEISWPYVRVVGGRV
jgi:hypothetical protein